MIRAILFDADDTVVDYYRDGWCAFAAALEAVGVTSPRAVEDCIAFDYENWERIGLSSVHLEEVQRTFHDLYRQHVRILFEKIAEKYGFSERTREAEETFYRALGREGHPVAGALETVRTLAANGLAYQKTRLSAFPFREIFISEELGAIKPTPEFFRRILARIGTDPAECLMVGDSLTSDIAGATRAGMPCVFYNPDGRPCPAGVPSIGALPELLELAEKWRQ